MLRGPGVTEPTAGQAPWYADGLRFECTQCGNCCGGAPGYVWVSEHEAREIAAFLDLSTEAFYEQHVRRVGNRYALLEKPNWDCAFLIPDKRGRKVCAIYSVRPIQCRTWPFWPSNVEARQTWKAAGESCPGIDRGKHHALPVIQQAMARNGGLPL